MSNRYLQSHRLIKLRSLTFRLSGETLLLFPLFFVTEFQHFGAHRVDTVRIVGITTQNFALGIVGYRWVSYEATVFPCFPHLKKCFPKM